VLAYRKPPLTQLLLGSCHSLLCQRIGNPFIVTSIRLLQPATLPAYRESPSTRLPLESRDPPLYQRIRNLLSRNFHLSITICRCASVPGTTFHATSISVLRSCVCQPTWTVHPFTRLSFLSCGNTSDTELIYHLHPLNRNCLVHSYSPIYTYTIIRLFLPSLLSDKTIRDSRRRLFVPAYRYPTPTRLPFQSCDRALASVPGPCAFFRRLPRLFP
jgi:hypothetical protein